MKKEDPTPADCFRLEELEIFQSFEHQLLQEANYYFWLHNPEPGSPHHRFLYCLELIFDRTGALLLSSGEDSTAIQIITAESLIKTAGELQALHGQQTIQRVQTEGYPLWEPVIDQALQAVRLSRHTSGLYLNDVLNLEFKEREIQVQLSRKEGLELVLLV